MADISDDGPETHKGAMGSLSLWLYARDAGGSEALVGSKNRENRVDIENDWMSSEAVFT